MIDSNENAFDAYSRALALSKSKQITAAIALFEAIIEGQFGSLEQRWFYDAEVKLLWCAARTKDWVRTENLARAAIARTPNFPRAYQYLGEGLLRQERRAEAREALEHAIHLDPTLVEARGLIDVLNSGVSVPDKRAKVRIWPQRNSAFDDPKDVVERYLLRYRPKADFITKKTRFLTLGSCFAQNLARRLEDNGYPVFSEAIGEEVNSTYANLYLLQWLEEGAVNGPTKAMEDVYGPAVRERLIRAFSEADVFVMTLGVAPCFFHKETGEFYFNTPKSQTGRDYLETQTSMRTTSVQENVDNLQTIIAAARRLSKRPIKMLLTVSPVPLSGTTELESAITADCLSKSTLRVACHEAVSAGGDDVIYWPSFEIVRWMGGHFGKEVPPVYGAEDGNTRHVSDWVVALIIDQFLAFHSAEETAPA